MRRTKDYLLLYLKGVSMGAADVVPGVSGGTIAFLTGIYEELIDSIKAIDLVAFRLLFSFQLVSFWKKINGNFLICILAGIITSVLSLSKLMVYLLSKYPISVWAFFFGLILVSSPLVLREIKKWNFVSALCFMVGVAAAYTITILPATETPANLFFILFGGILAISAMMLPGVSGVFILLVIGQYEYISAGISNINIPIIIAFVLGGFLGLMGFSRALSWMLEHYRFPTLAMLAGIMIGSLNKVWPWKEIISYRINAQGLQVPAFDHSVWPFRYLEATGKDPQLFYAILFAAAGIFLVVAIEKTASYLKSKN